MKNLAFVAVAALAFGGAAVAFAADEDMFQRADGNGDKMISLEEAMGVYPTLTDNIFKQADANGDGSLDEAEFSVLVGLSAGLASNEPSSSSSESSSSSSSQSSSSSSSAQ